ncbi:hypothetical protein KM043_008737 [Ampulex compressa]|nr:hypothetical protein KM043_008737 [Ampulex compressa]
MHGSSFNYDNEPGTATAAAVAPVAKREKEGTRRRRKRGEDGWRASSRRRENVSSVAPPASGRGYAPSSKNVTRAWKSRDNEVGRV